MWQHYGNPVKRKQNVTILKNNELKKIYDDKILTSIDTYSYKNLVLAIPQYNLKKLSEFNDFKLLDSVEPIELLRILTFLQVTSTNHSRGRAGNF